MFKYQIDHLLQLINYDKKILTPSQKLMAVKIYIHAMATDNEPVHWYATKELRKLVDIGFIKKLDYEGYIINTDCFEPRTTDIYGFDRNITEKSVFKQEQTQESDDIFSDDIFGLI